MSKKNKSIAEYIKQVGTWSKKNFDYQDKIGLGVVEELGEYAHAELKFRQKIRGYDTMAKAEEARLDALADATIFLFNLAYTHRVKLSWTETPQINNQGKEHAMKYLAKALGKISDWILDRCYSSLIVGHLLNDTLYYIALIARCHGTDLIDDVFLPTWREVKKRNWRKYPKNGINE